MNLRAGLVNGFDIQTCKAMQQVQEISDASIFKQLALDDSEWSDMVAEMRIVVPYDNGQKGFLRFHQNGSGFDGTVPGNMPGRGNNGIR